MPHAFALLAAVTVTFSQFTPAPALAEGGPQRPFLTEEAPLGSLARAFGFAVEGEITTGLVRLVSGDHEIVIAPGLCRALVDGRGLPLLGSPRYAGGRLVIPPDLADLVRRLGLPSPEAGAPFRRRPAPGVRPKAAYLPAPTEPSRAILAGGSSEDGASPEDGKGAPKGARGPAGFVVIDPGHGGRDEGARGRAGTKEKEVVLDIARRTAALLRRKGVGVALTREDDRYLRPEKRAAVANSLRPDALVSLHTNSYALASVSGVETWVLDPKLAPAREAARRSTTLARAVQRALVKATGLRDRGVRRGRYRVLRASKVPAVLVEVGFISNPKDEKMLTRAKSRQRIARALAEAILGSGVLVKRAKRP